MTIYDIQFLNLFQQAALYIDLLDFKTEQFVSKMSKLPDDFPLVLSECLRGSISLFEDLHFFHQESPITWHSIA